MEIKNTPADATPSTTPDTVICSNCHTKVLGAYCSQCGQSVESTLKYFWTVILHLLDDIFSFDSRASRTLIPLLFRPGFLTNEYIAGRRVHYVPPLRLYLFISIIFFLALNIFTANSLFDSSTTEESSKKVTTYLSELTEQKARASELQNKELIESLTKEIEKFNHYQQLLTDKSAVVASKVTEDIVAFELKKIQHGGKLSEDEEAELLQALKQIELIKNDQLSDSDSEDLTIGNNEDGTLSFEFLSEENNKKLNDFTEILERKAKKAFNSDPTPLFKESINKLPQLMFIVLPLFAALLKIMYLFSKRLYMEHLTVALHSHSFIFLSILIVQCLDWLHKHINESHTFILGIIEYLGYAVLIWLPIYLLLMQKRVYRQGKIFTFIKYQVIGVLYFTLLGFTALIAFIWGLTDAKI